MLRELMISLLWATPAGLIAFALTVLAMGHNSVGWLYVLVITPFAWPGIALIKAVGGGDQWFYPMLLVDCIWMTLLVLLLRYGLRVRANR